MTAVDALLDVPLARSLLAALTGAMVGLGLWVGVTAVLARKPDSAVRPGTEPAGMVAEASEWLTARLPDPSRRYLVLVVLLAGTVTAGFLHLPVIALFVAGCVLLATETMQGPSLAQLNELGAAVAAWSETVRQELEAGQPQRAALIAACEIPPAGLEGPLVRLAGRLEAMPVPDALWAFSREVQHPAAGHTVAALDVAYRFGAADLPRLMAGQVESTRHQVQMLREVNAARAKHRRAMLLLLALFVAVIVVLFLVWPDLLAAYRGLQGQLVLAAIGAAVLIAVRALIRLSRASPPPIFFTGPDPDSGNTLTPSRTTLSGTVRNKGAQLT